MGGCCPSSVLRKWYTRLRYDIEGVNQVGVPPLVVIRIVRLTSWECRDEEVGEDLVSRTGEIPNFDDAIADAGCEPGVPWFDGDAADPAEIARMMRTSFQEVW